MRHNLPRSNGTKRVQLDFSKEKCITDQAPAQELTMASIMRKLEKGIMPRLKEGLIYTTDLGVRNLQDVLERKKEVNDLFHQLPTEIRSLMKNDISNFDKVIKDKENEPVLLKYGLKVQKRDEHVELLNAINAMKVSTPISDTPPKDQKQS